MFTALSIYLTNHIEACISVPGLKSTVFLECIEEKKLTCAPECQAPTLQSMVIDTQPQGAQVWASQIGKLEY